MQPDLIEGSKARAEAKRKEPHLFDAFAQEGDQLGDPVVVDALVRGFFVRLSELRIQVHKQEVSPEECLNQIQTLSQNIADIFTGKKSGYVKSSWNTDAQLGAYIHQVCTGAGSPEQATKSFFLHMASRVFETMRAHEEEEIDDEVMQFQIDATVEDTTQVLLGLEPPNDE